MKEKYRVKNWRKYNQALVNRGNICIWFHAETIKGWRSKTHTGLKGRPQTYSDEAILSALVIRSVYHLSLRALVGFLQSLSEMLSLDLPIPCYTRICRRAHLLGKTLKKLTNKQPSDIVIDSSGIKVYGEGEWKVRTHGKSKRREWRKIHLAICPKSHKIIKSKLTDKRTVDFEVGIEFIQSLPKRTKRILGDGAYDKSACYRSAYKGGRHLIAPPQKNARLRDLEKEPWMKDRNENVSAIHALGNDEKGIKLWKKLKRYNTRSLVETAMYRFKQAFGERFRSREFYRQRAELYAKSVAINIQTALGMPKSERVTA